MSIKRQPLPSRTFSPAASTSVDAESVSPPNHAWRSAAMLGLGYFIAASVGLATTRIGGGIAYCWLATALLVPFLARKPVSRWPAPLATCAIASMLAVALFGAGAWMAAPFGIALMGEAAIGAWLLQRFQPDARYFDTAPQVARYAFLVGVIMPMISAFGGAAVVDVGYGMTYLTGWMTWYVVHALGMLTFSPIVVLLTEDTDRRRLRDFDPRHGGGANLAMTLAMILIVGITFGQTRLPVLFLPILPLILLTLRAGRLGAALGICILAVGGGVLTMMGHGPAVLASSDHAIRAMFFQLYLAGTVMTILPVAADLNHRKTLGRKLGQSEAMFHLMADRSGDVLMNLDVEGRIRYCSPSIANFGSFDPAGLVGKHSLKLIAEDDRTVAAAMHSRALARPNDTFVFEYRALTAAGSMTWFESHIKAIIDTDGNVSGVVSTARDITRHKLFEAELVDTANSDVMTGLSNRRSFDNQLLRALRLPDRAANAGCLAIIDIDFFKQVNDVHGHAAGDQVLKAVAARLQLSVRANDFVARIGGEEFGIVLWGLKQEDADALCERLREDVAVQHIKIGATIITVTVSIGIAALSDHAALPALFSAADAALYCAKSEGRNCVRLAA